MKRKLTTTTETTTAAKTQDKANAETKSKIQKQPTL